MSTVRTSCPYCGVGCGIAVTRDDGGLRVDGDARHPANFGRLCSKGAALAETLDLDGRLLYPTIGGERVEWDAALNHVARGFESIIGRYGPNAVAFYVSGQLLTEDYYVANKLMKGFIGSANIDTNSRLCMASAVAAHQRAFGADFVPNAYEDIDRAELLVLVGSNMAWCHPVLYQRARQAKEENPRLRVVVIDPRRTASCDIADLFLPIRPGSDVVLFNGLLNYLRCEDALDWEFVDEHTEGFGRAMRLAKESAPSVPAAAAACGLGERQVAEFYRLFARTDRTVTLFSQGVNQSSNGTDKVNSIINVHLATGRIGRAGAGPFSLTGQPNAMGGREVGGLANQLAAHMDFSPDNVDRVKRFWNAPAIATAPGLKAVELFDAIDAGSVRAVWIMSTNPAVSMPDADRVRSALQRCELVVVSDCVRETDTTACADVLLPALTWGEKSGTVTNSERRISRQRKFLPAPGAARADWWIVTEVARRMSFGAAFPYRSPAEIFREHARLSSFENDGRRDFDIGALASISDDDYETLEPIRWPCRAGGKPGEAPPSAGRFFTANGKARFVATEPRQPRSTCSDDYPYVLLTGRVRDQWHTMTRTGKSPRLAQTDAEPRLQLHPADAADLGLVHGGLAELRSASGAIRARVEFSDALRPGELFVPMHWSAQFASNGRVGSLIEPAVDPVSGQPEFKHTPVAVRPLSVAWHGFALSRRAIDVPAADYRVRSRGAGFWRYEIAGPARPESWARWARGVFGQDGEWVELVDSSAMHYRGARLVDGRLDACVFITSANALPDRSWLGSLFGEAPLGDGDRKTLLAGRPAGRDRAPGPVVCSCFSVGRDTLLRAIRTHSMTTAREIGEALRAGTNCGSCIPELNRLIDRCHSFGSASLAIESPVTRNTVQSFSRRPPRCS